MVTQTTLSVLASSLHKFSNILNKVFNICWMPMSICSIRFIHIKNKQASIVPYLKFTRRGFSTNNLKIFTKIFVSVFKRKCIC